MYGNLNIATPFPKTINRRYFIAPPWSNMPFWYLVYIQQTQLYAKGLSGSLWETLIENLFLIRMNNYALIYDLFVPFFIKVVVNKRKAYSFLITGMIHLQKKYYFQLECCDSIFSLLSRALEYLNATDVLLHFDNVHIIDTSVSKNTGGPAKAKIDRWYVLCWISCFVVCLYTRCIWCWNLTPAAWSTIIKLDS